MKAMNTFNPSYVQRLNNAYSYFPYTVDSIEKIASQLEVPLTPVREHIAHKLTESENKANIEPSNLPNFQGFKEPHFIEVKATTRIINGKTCDILPSLINFE